MSQKARATAAKILFDLVVSLEPRLVTLRHWYFETVKQAEAWHLSEGNQGIKRMKDCLSYGWETILGERPAPLDFVRSDKSGCPLVVQPLVRRVMSLRLDARLMSAVQSLVRLTDFWEGVPETRAVLKSLDIIQESKLVGTARKEISLFEEWVPQFFKAYPNHPVTRAYQAAIHLDDSDGFLYRQSKGPNGTLIANVHRDWLTLAKTVLPSGRTLLAEVESFQDFVGSELSDMSFGCSHRLGDAIKDFGVEKLDQLVGSADLPGKLSLKSEKSGKVRVVAMPDYLTQLTLAPVHRWLMRILKSFPCDYTYDQRAALPFISKWQSTGDGFTASFDQSACTDRFPFDYQLGVIRPRFGLVGTESFRAIVSDRSWSIKLPDGKVRTVRWSVGQPLGMFGSWPLMAISHHLLVQYCYWITRGRSFGKDIFNKYAICGDDIVIADKAVARQYLILCKRLGLVINEAKSHKSGGDTGVPPVSEFAKVTVWRGTPLTPIKPKMVLSAVLDARCAIPLFFDLASSTVWAVRRRYIELIIRKYFPREKNFLTTLLTIPREFGGLGFRDDRSIRRLFGDLKLHQIHPLLYYIADRIRKRMKKERAALASSESYTAAIPKELFREHPLLDYLRTKQQELSRRDYALGGDLPNIWEIISDLVINGFERYSYLLTEDVTPDYPFAPSTVEKQVATTWQRVLSKDHVLPEDKRKDSHLFSDFPLWEQPALVQLWHRLTEEPEDWFLDRQLRVIESFVLAERSRLHVETQEN